MHPQSLEDLCGRLENLAQDNNPGLMLIMRPRGTSNGVIVVRDDRRVRLCYSHYSWFELKLPYRCWLFGLRSSLRPRFARWGKGLVTCLELNSNSRDAAITIEHFYNFVFAQPSPFVLEFQGWSLRAPEGQVA